MAKRTIEETFQTIKPKGSGGRKAPTISVDVASNNTDLSASLSQAGQQIAQLQSAYQAQASLIAANTQAVHGNTSAQGSHSAGSVAGGIASSLFGGLGLLSPLISGIASLFGGNSTPAPLPVYQAPSRVAINATLNSATPGSASVNSVSGQSAQNGGTSSQSASGSLTAPAAPQVTVNVTAMDSQSFMDHSTDIANAVREAMLNMHPINGVVATL
jgi:hypothetical protein